MSRTWPCLAAGRRVVPACLPKLLARHPRRVRTSEALAAHLPALGGLTACQCKQELPRQEALQIPWVPWLHAGELPRQEVLLGLPWCRYDRHWAEAQLRRRIRFGGHLLPAPDARMAPAGLAPRGGPQGPPCRVPGETGMLGAVMRGVVGIISEPIRGVDEGELLPRHAFSTEPRLRRAHPTCPCHARPGKRPVHSIASARYSSATLSVCFLLGPPACVLQSSGALQYHLLFPGWLAGWLAGRTTPSQCLTMAAPRGAPSCRRPGRLCARREARGAGLCGDPASKPPGHVGSHGRVHPPRSGRGQQPGLGAAAQVSRVAAGAGTLCDVLRGPSLLCFGVAALLHWENPKIGGVAVLAGLAVASPIVHACWWQHVCWQVSRGLSYSSAHTKAGQVAIWPSCLYTAATRRQPCRSCCSLTWASPELHRGAWLQVRLPGRAPAALRLVWGHGAMAVIGAGAVAAGGPGRAAGPGAGSVCALCACSRQGPLSSGDHPQGRLRRAAALFSSLPASLPTLCSRWGPGSALATAEGLHCPLQSWQLAAVVHGIQLQQHTSSAALRSSCGGYFRWTG
jgi:hypothetical protein